MAKSGLPPVNDFPSSQSRQLAAITNQYISEIT